MFFWVLNSISAVPSYSPSSDSVGRMWRSTSPSCVSVYRRAGQWQNILRSVRSCWWTSRPEMRPICA